MNAREEYNLHSDEAKAAIKGTSPGQNIAK
jgi:hypothetical protein